MGNHVESFLVVEPHRKQIASVGCDFIEDHLVDQELVRAAPAALFSPSLFQGDDVIGNTVVLEEGVNNSSKQFVCGVLTCDRSVILCVLRVGVFRKEKGYYIYFIYLTWVVRYILCYKNISEFAII